jgi:hypothetical protein
MTTALDRSGTFRAEITDYILMAPFPSGSIPVDITVRLTAMWDPDEGEGGEWVPWAEFEMDATGLQWIIKKDGGLNESTVHNLIDHAGWDGNLDSISNRTWQPTPCQVVCNEEGDEKRRKDNDQYGRSNFSIDFVNAHDAIPGGGKREMAPEMAKQLQTRHGAALRALAGNTKRNATAPKGKPSAPPAAKSTASEENPANAALQEAAKEGSKGDDNIPF